MLEKMLPQYYQESIKPIDKTEIHNVKKYQLLPEKINDKEILQGEKTLAELEMADILLKKYSDIALRIQEKSLDINATRLQHREKSNDNAQKFKRQMLQHHKKELLTNLDNSSLNASTEGIHSGFEMIQKSIML
jgi:hypothetical protein